MSVSLLISVNVFICVIKQLATCKYCALLSYTRFITIIGVKTDSLFKGVSSGAL